MCVPSAVSGVVATALASTALSVVKSVRTLTSGLYAMTATGSRARRSARKALAAAIAPSIGAPRMLSEASMRTMAPLVLALDSTARPCVSRVTWRPFSARTKFAVVSIVGTGVR